MTDLTAGAAYTYAAYSDSACTTPLATAASFTTLDLTASAITETTATLTISGHTAAWWYRETSPSTGTCTAVAANTTAASLTELTGGTAYAYEAYDTAGCDDADEIASETFTAGGGVTIAAGETLTASAITQTTATLTIANHTGDWYYQYTTPTGGTCSSAQTGTTASLTTLTADTAYTYAAYSDSTCTTLLATAASFTTLDLTASAITQTTATLTIANHTTAWWYKQTSPSAGTCTSVAANTATASLTTLSGATAYTYAAYSDSACATLLATTAAFTTLDLTASAITQTTATLTIANHTGDWYYQYTTPTGGTCSSAQTGTTASLTTLTADTAYTYAAYSDSGCTTLLATAASFTTLDLTATAITRTTATLTIANHSAAWWYKQTSPSAGTCNSVAANTSTASLTSLDAGTSHTYAAYSNAACTALLGTVVFNTPDLTLSTPQLIVPEGDTTTYTVRLPSAPTASVTVTLSTSGDSDITANPTTLTFTTTNWATAQTVTLSAAEETDNTDKAYGTTTITHTAASTDTVYNTVTSALTATEGDNDVCQGQNAVGPATGQIVTDCNTLLAAKAMLAGTSTSLVGWRIGLSMASWTGITYNTTDGVTQIDLSNQSLNGSIPNTLGDLTNLTQLNLFKNSLTGPIPAQLGDLANLTNLNLSNNSLTGSIPAQLGDLTNLTSLNLIGNDLSGSIPAQLGDLTNLTSLEVNSNDLTGWIPAQLGSLTNLTNLRLDRNDLTGSIPTQLGNLANLTLLYLSNNDLTGSIPAQLGSLTNLTSLRLDNNDLTGSIPAQLGNLANLTQLWLFGNSLSGCVPANLVAYLDTIQTQADGVSLAACGGIAVSNAQLSVTEGSTATFTVRLSTEPTASVTVTLTTSGDSDITANLTTLTFTTTNWDTAQTVTLTAAADDDALDGTATITHTATSTDSAYNSITSTVTATEADNDSGLTVSLITSTTAKLTIGGHTAAWWYKQTSPSSGTCTSVAANTASVNLAGLGKWRTHTYKAYDTAGCNSADEIASETFRTVTDADASWLYFAHEIPDLVLRVGEPFSYVMPDQLCAEWSTCSPSFSIHEVLPNGLSFDGGTGGTRVLSGTPTTEQTATSYTLDSHDGSAYANAIRKFTIEILAAQDLSLSDSRVALAEGSSNTGTYTVKLPTAPTGTVTVTVASGDSGAVTVDTDAGTDGNQSTLTFTTTNWATAQTVTLAAVSDADGANESVTITHSASGGGYDDKSATLTAAVSDDDSAIVISPVSPLRIDKGSSGSLALALASKPSDTVTILVTTHVGGATIDTDTAAAGDQHTLTFTPTNYNTARYVSITATQADNFDNRGNDLRRFRISAHGGSYGGLAADHDVFLKGVVHPASVTISTSTLTLTEGGDSATFTVALAGSSPRQETSVDVVSSDTGAVTAVPSQLTFQTQNYQVPQTVTLTPITDSDSDSESVTITVSAAEEACGNHCDESATLTVTVVEGTIGLTAGAVTQTTATLTIGGHTGAWWYKQTSPGTGSCTSVAANTSTAALRGLTGATAYTYKAYSDSGCTTELTDNTTDAEFTTRDLTASAITKTTATLTISGHSTAWSYKKTSPEPAGSCTTVAANTSTASLANLTAATDYTYTAYSDIFCTTLLGTVTFATPGLTLSKPRLVLPEGATDTYTVRLLSAPSASVTVTLTASGDSDITADTDTAAAGNQNTLTFSTTNWATAQTVTLTAAEDNADTSNGTTTITHTATSTDTAYNNITSTVTVTEGDNDICQGTDAVGGVSSGQLVDDCNTLLAAKTLLAGTSTSLDNWDTTLAVDSWTGITADANGVTRITLIEKGLNGSIPNTLGNLTNLTHIWLHRNSLTGSIPAGLGNLTNLTHLYLDRNDLTGSIPTQLGNLTNLTTLWLFSNSLTGSIPNTLGNLTNLTQLHLYGNSLTGSIPQQLGNLTNLTQLYLDGNSLTEINPNTTRQPHQPHTPLSARQQSDRIDPNTTRQPRQRHTSLATRQLSNGIDPNTTRQPHQPHTPLSARQFSDRIDPNTTQQPHQPHTPLSAPQRSDGNNPNTTQQPHQPHTPCHERQSALGVCAVQSGAPIDQDQSPGRWLELGGM